MTYSSIRGWYSWLRVTYAKHVYACSGCASQSVCLPLSTCVCVCVSMCLCVYVCMYVCMYFCMHLYRDTAPLNTKSIRPQPCWLESKTGKHRSCGWDHLCKHKIPTYMHTYNMRMPACILGCVHNYIGAHTRTRIHARAHTHTLTSIVPLP